MGYGFRTVRKSLIRRRIARWFLRRCFLTPMVPDIYPGQEAAVIQQGLPESSRVISNHDFLNFLTADSHGGFFVKPRKIS